MAMREIDPIGQAITETEKEIAGDAWGEEGVVLDETGDRSLEAMGEGLEGQHEPDDDDEPESESEEDEGEESEESGEEGEKDEPKGEPEKDEPKGRVPSARLREQTERASKAEAERDALKAQLDAKGKDIEALNARFDGLVAELKKQPQQAAQQTQTQEKAPPDPLEDPQGFARYVQEEGQKVLNAVLDRLEQQRVNTSLSMAKRHYAETFDKAFAALQKLDPRNPDDLATGRRLMADDDPGEAMIQWFKRNETLREVGDDPGKFRERIAAETREALMKDPEFRKHLLDSLRAEAQTGDDGRPRTQVRLPKSLNGAAGGNSARNADPLMYDDSDSAVADSAWR